MHEQTTMVWHDLNSPKYYSPPTVPLTVNCQKLTKNAVEVILIGLKENSDNWFRMALMKTQEDLELSNDNLQVEEDLRESILSASDIFYNKVEEVLLSAEFSDFEQNFETQLSEVKKKYDGILLENKKDGILENKKRKVEETYCSECQEKKN